MCGTGNDSDAQQSIIVSLGIRSIKNAGPHAIDCSCILITAVLDIGSSVQAGIQSNGDRVLSFRNQPADLQPVTGIVCGQLTAVYDNCADLIRAVIKVDDCTGIVTPFFSCGA